VAPSGERLGGYELSACATCRTRLAAGALVEHVDYDAVYRAPEYVADQVEPIESGVDPEVFARHATYAPFFREVPFRPGATLLDVGCGAGRFALAAHGRGWHVTGIDLSEEAVRVAAGRVPFPVRRATLDEALAPGTRFDVITSFEVLEHLRSPVEFAALARSGLAPGGTFFATVPNWDCAPVRTATRADWLPPVHLSFFTRSGLVGLASRAGFTDIVVGGIDADPWPGGVRGQLAWLSRRLQARPRESLGLWLAARR
jgi:SAM-dependent methyltransferase